MILTRGFLVLFYFLAIVVGNANADWDLDKIIKEADQGDAYAQYNLANGYFNGYWGIEQNYKKAVELYKKAAEQGHPLATFKLGEIYANGKGVQKDHIEAAEWYKKAAKIYIKEAEQGDVYSQVQLGDMYYKGLGLSRDYSEALKWYSKASKQGYADGQGRIGRMYLDGNGVPQDIVYAYAWFNLAASKDTFVYKNARDRLKILLTPKQVEEGQKLSRELFEKYGGLEK